MPGPSSLTTISDAVRADANVFRASLRRIQKEIYEHPLPSGRVALQAKLSVDLGAEADLPLDWRIPNSPGKIAKSFR